jgi:N-acetylglutamate synthase-like GNAT family acetyltransferase
MTTALPLALGWIDNPAIAALRGREAPARGLVIQSGRDRLQTESFIRDVFAAAHGARLGTLMPTILAERNAEGGIVAACGLRSAAESALFLERYLDGTIEEKIAATGVPRLDRSDIVEVGNLAVRAPYTARELIATLTEYLLAGDAEWSVFTAVPALRNAFARLGVPFQRLGIARIEALPERDRAAWGCYYDKVPEVLGVRVRDAAYALLTRPRP